MNVVCFVLGVLWAAGGCWLYLTAKGVVAQAKQAELTPEVRSNWRRTGLLHVFGGLLVCVLSFVV